MPTSGLRRPPRYHSYLLRCWSDGPGPWRFSVEDPYTGARRAPRRGRRADRCLAPLTRPSARGVWEAALAATGPTHDPLTIHLRSPSRVPSPRQHGGVPCIGGFDTHSAR